MQCIYCKVKQWIQREKWHTIKSRLLCYSRWEVPPAHIYRSNTLAIRLLYIYQSCLRYGNTKMNYHAISLEVEERGRGRRFTTLRPCYYIWMLNPRISLTSPSSIGDHLSCQSSNRNHPFKSLNKTQFRQAIQFKTKRKMT